MSANATHVRSALLQWAANVHDQTCRQVPDLMRPHAPIGKGLPGARSPGALRASIMQDGDVAGQGSARLTGRISAPVIQARTTDQGSPAHPIEPRGPYPLRFFWPKAGGFVASWGWHGRHFGMVEHPGNDAQNWWLPALRLAFIEAQLAAARSVAFAA